MSGRRLLRASDFYQYLTPCECKMRVYLKQKGVAEAEQGPFKEVMKKLGERHEKEYLKSIDGIVEDLSSLKLSEHISRTKELLQEGVSTIYQPAFMVDETLDSGMITIIGFPDFVCKEGNSYIIRDCKLSRRINEKDHPEIFKQLDLYGWLYEKTMGQVPVRLEVLSGSSDVVEIPYKNGSDALEMLREIKSAQDLQEEPYCPVGWSDCQQCGYFERCWRAAEESRDPALLPGVDKGLAVKLHEIGMKTIEDIAQMDSISLSELRRPWGKGMQKVGKKADSIIKHANALIAGNVIIVGKLYLPESRNYVIFDIEGVPPMLDEMNKIYLWGFQVFGEDKSEFIYSLADYGDEGDRDGWFGFLENCRKIFDKYGDLPFIHWASYEKTWIEVYLKRYGDDEGLVERVKGNLVDLMKLTKEAVVLPDYSYSLKRIEKLAGFKRALAEGRGDWSIAKYIEATEMKDLVERKKMMDEIVKYNQEDLEATWAVLQWLLEICRR
jgi:predicted RecB family nuclease